MQRTTMFGRQMPGRLAMAAAVALVLVSGNGCAKQKILIKVKADGSGNMLVTKIFAKETVTMYEAQIQAMKKQMEGRPEAEEMASRMAKDPFYNERALKREARIYGLDVKFVKGQKYDKDGARGSVALYSFSDINELRIPLGYLGPQSMEMMGGMMGGGMDEEMDEEAMENYEEMMADRLDTLGEGTYEFKLTKGSPNLLRITIPEFGEAQDNLFENEDDEEGEKDEDDLMTSAPMAGPQAEMQAAALVGMGNPFGMTGAESEEEMMMKTMRGMRLTLLLEIEGVQVESNASYPDKTKKNRCILLDLDMDKMMETTDVRKLQNSSVMNNMDSPAEAYGAMRNVPGMTLETKTNLVIKFN